MRQASIGSSAVENRTEKEMVSRELDLIRVDPAQRATILRRIAGIEQYLALHDPSIDDLKDAAERIGLSAPQFYVALRAWKATREPSHLPGAKVRGGRDRARQDDIGTVAVAEKIATDHPSASSGRMTELLREALPAAGMAVPGQATLTRRVREARAKVRTATFQSPADLIIDTAYVSASLAADGDKARLPSLTCAFSMPSRLLVGWTVSRRPPEAHGIASLIAASAASMPLGDGHVAEGDEAPCLQLPPMDDEVAARTFEAATSAGWTPIASTRKRDRGVVIRALVGDLVGGFHLQSVQKATVLRVPAKTFSLEEVVERVALDLGRSPATGGAERDLVARLVEALRRSASADRT